MVRGVLFDFYGTLARAVAWGPTHQDVFARHGFSLEPGVWDRWDELDVLDGGDHRQHSGSREDYVAWEQDRLRQRAAQCGVGPDELEALVADLYAVRKTFSLEAYDEVPEVLTALRHRGVSVVVCSNWDWDLDRALDQAGVAPLVDLAVTSAQAGARKPHPHIYQFTLERSGLAPEDVLFVGDSWLPDVEGPLAAGLRPVHLWREGEPGTSDEPPELVEGVTRANDLRAVLDLASAEQP